MTAVGASDTVLLLGHVVRRFFFCVIFSFFMSWSFSLCLGFCSEVQSIQKPLSSVMLLGNVSLYINSVFFCTQEVAMDVLATINDFIQGSCFFLINVLQWTVSGSTEVSLSWTVLLFFKVIILKTFIISNTIFDTIYGWHLFCYDH